MLFRSKLRSEELQRKGRRRRWLIDYPRGIPVLIFILVTGITVLSVFAIERGEKQRDAADVARKAQAMTSAIERRAYTSSAYLRAGAALLSTQDEVTPELFRRFVSELRLCQLSWCGGDRLGSGYRGGRGRAFREPSRCQPGRGKARFPHARRAAARHADADPLSPARHRPQPPQIGRASCRERV